MQPPHLVIPSPVSHACSACPGQQRSDSLVDVLPWWQDCWDEFPEDAAGAATGVEQNDSDEEVAWPCAPFGHGHGRACPFVSLGDTVRVPADTLTDDVACPSDMHVDRECDSARADQTGQAPANAVDTLSDHPWST